MEDSMPARTTRKDARERLLKTFMASLDRIIPEDEAKPLRGSVFRDWEEQVGRLRRDLMPAVLEERAALEDNACVESGGPCPFCGSDSTRLEKQITTPEVITPDGPAVVQKQHCRCRACGGSFSPSEP
jgi:hypothetical protein